MKIIFIINSIEATLPIKRIEEFIAQGYEVEAYGFSQLGHPKSHPKNFTINTIGSYTSKTPYWKRFLIINKGIRNVIKKHRNEKNIIYYLFLLQTAMAFCLQSKQQYIYEESDMLHTYLKNFLLRNTLEVIDKWIIRNSLVSVFTSEGFLYYHFKETKLSNTFIITNRLTTDIEKYPKKQKEAINNKQIRIGFVGNLRFNSVINFADTLCQNFPDKEMHFWGSPIQKWESGFNNLKKYTNCYFHGKFTNPDDLPYIYSKIDVVLSAYDTDSINPRYAEPNKLYESIYFNTPIIVSSDTFLAKKVKLLGIGYEVNALDKNSIIELIKSITVQSIQEKIRNCKLIDKRHCLNYNSEFFDYLYKLLNK